MIFIGCSTWDLYKCILLNNDFLTNTRMNVFLDLRTSVIYTKDAGCVELSVKDIKRSGIQGHDKRSIGIEILVILRDVHLYIDSDSLRIEQPIKLTFWRNQISYS
ncbi:hypothetical protein HNY73_004616 [Argiope bruennichi]|uniref:Uncharacterized protein n=1 Tax=Argiope bruennichi TaxID=94029 RepID=A0A8T0FPS3_ARGBR|nr:hypothetical protein HNY73_004616 [Argiope bruennichi]